MQRLLSYYHHCTFDQVYTFSCFYDISISAIRAGFSLVAAVPGYRASLRFKDQLPITVIQEELKVGVSRYGRNIPGIIYAIRIRGKGIGNK